jgi:hypothetical protein
MRFTKEFVLHQAIPSRPFRKPTIWKLLNVAEEIGVTLTESMAMWPASSSVRLLHIQKKYFGLGKIKEDQVLITPNVEVFLQIKQ